MFIYTYENEGRVCMIIATSEQEAYERLELETALYRECKLLSTTPTLGGWVMASNLLPF